MEVSWATPLYEFLRQCNKSPLPKQVLDCGAGGDEPPLSLFYQYGYRTFGLEIAEEPLAKAKRFCMERGMQLNIIDGDMRRIPCASESFSFVYSYNAIFFMTKPDIERALAEILRVLRPGGLCFVNFMSVDDPDNRPFRETSSARNLLRSERFARHEDEEADDLFDGFQVLRKEKRLIEKTRASGILKQAYIEYIVQKTGGSCQSPSFH